MSGLKKKKSYSHLSIIESGIGNVTHESKKIKVKRLFSNYKVAIPDIESQHMSQRALDYLKSNLENGVKSTKSANEVPKSLPKGIMFQHASKKMFENLTENS